MVGTKNKNILGNGSKKTRIGKGKNSKFGNKGGGNGGSTPSKNYRKKSRGQGR
jgi:hypothetical protein